MSILTKTIVHLVSKSSYQNAQSSIYEQFSIVSQFFRETCCLLLAARVSPARFEHIS